LKQLHHLRLLGGEFIVGAPPVHLLTKPSNITRLSNPDTILLSLSPMHQLLFTPFEAYPSTNVGGPFPIYPDSPFIILNCDFLFFDNIFKYFSFLPTSGRFLFAKSMLDFSPHS
jgi:hypothetical protein